MRKGSLFSLAGLSASVSAFALQPRQDYSLPACASTCYSNPTNTGGCALSNTACLCGSQTFLQAAMLCTEENCKSSTGAVEQAVLAVIYACAQVDLTLTNTAVNTGDLFPTVATNATAVAPTATAAIASIESSFSAAYGFGYPTDGVAAAGSTSAPSSQGAHKSHTGAIIGAVIGVIVVLIALAVLLLFILRRRRSAQPAREQSARPVIDGHNNPLPYGPVAPVRPMMEENKSYASTTNVQSSPYMQYNNPQQQMPYQQYNSPPRMSMTSDAPLPPVPNQHQQHHYPSHQQPLPGQAPDAPAFLAVHQQHNTHLPPHPTQAPPPAPPSSVTSYSVSSSSPSQGQMAGFYLAQGQGSAPAPAPSMTNYSVSSASSPPQTKAQMAGFHSSQYSPVLEKQTLPPPQSSTPPAQPTGQPSSSQNLSPQQLDIMMQRIQHLSPQQLEMVDRMAESSGQTGGDEPPPMYDQAL